MGVCVFMTVFVSVSLRRWQESQLGQPKKSNQKKKRKDTQPSQVPPVVTSDVIYVYARIKLRMGHILNHFKS